MAGLGGCQVKHGTVTHDGDGNQRHGGTDLLTVRAWGQGVELCGLSAGMNCWFSE